MFTNESKKVASIFDKAEIVKDGLEQLKSSQLKLLDARPEMRQLDKESQNIHIILGEEDTADQDVVDTHSDKSTKSSVVTSSCRAHMPIWVPLNS